MFTKQKAIKAANEALRPLIETQKLRTGEVPVGFWDDPYILGFLVGIAASFSNLATNGKLHGENLGIVIGKTLSSYSNLPISVITERIFSLVSAPNSDYQLGMEAAQKLVNVTYGIGDYSSDQDVEKARQLSMTLGSFDPSPSNTQQSDTASVSAALMQILFHNEVEERLDIAQ